MSKVEKDIAEIEPWSATMAWARAECSEAIPGWASETWDGEDEGSVTDSESYMVSAIASEQKRQQFTWSVDLRKEEYLLYVTVAIGCF